jgi:hydrogenase-1 operon protein HyaF
MTDPVSFSDDGLVDALLMEVAGMLGRLIEHGETASIDLRGLPLTPACIANLEKCLGHGEISVQLDAAGRSEIRETGFSGVWWTRHCDETGRIIAMLIEVTTVPDILRAESGDMADSLQRLAGATHFASHQHARQA